MSGSAPRGAVPAIGWARTRSPARSHQELGAGPEEAVDVEQEAARVRRLQAGRAPRRGRTGRRPPRAPLGRGRPWTDRRVRRPEDPRWPGPRGRTTTRGERAGVARTEPGPGMHRRRVRGRRMSRPPGGPMVVTHASSPARPHTTSGITSSALGVLRGRAARRRPPRRCRGAAPRRSSGWRRAPRRRSVAADSGGHPPAGQPVAALYVKHAVRPRPGRAGRPARPGGGSGRPAVRRRRSWRGGRVDAGGGDELRDAERQEPAVHVRNPASASWARKTSGGGHVGHRTGQVPVRGGIGQEAADERHDLAEVDAVPEPQEAVRRLATRRGARCARRDGPPGPARRRTEAGPGSCAGRTRSWRRPPTRRGRAARGRRPGAAARRCGRRRACRRTGRRRPGRSPWWASSRHRSPVPQARSMHRGAGGQPERGAPCGGASPRPCGTS